SKVFYHEWTSGSGRMFTDTHFAGWVPKEIAVVNNVPYVEEDGANVFVRGYNINPGSKNACTSCHDPHAASKMLAAGSDDNTNAVVQKAQAMGMTHMNYLADQFSRNQNGCTPCHTGRDYTKLTYGATIADLGSPRWNTLGC